MKNAFLFIVGSVAFYGSLWLLLVLLSPNRSLNNERLFRPFPHACQ
jgi:hypothetical protein